ncbi:tyrosine-protein phosphatase non-receptor type 23 [Anopheles nili]|uniref:tyrosine-protein phosphatase non-receptor type 23 n=1 Tax=Anopheles nili TaxID=185578 RepID=UPI00237C1DFF|nr:tyrosine-protein phosphatase non-receptor type 23 [Anopheles nili]
MRRNRQVSMIATPSVVLLLLATANVSAIRVDWNTNTGPIVPPTSTPAPVPQPPFRDPAPVWEDQSDDIPNPNPYRYILPPPSRPKYNDITLEQRKQSQQQQHHHNHQTVAPVNPTLPSTTAAPTGQIIDRPQQQQQQQASGVNPTGSPAQHTTVHHQPQQQPQQQQPHVVPSLAVQYVPNKGLKYYAVVPRHTEVSYGSAKQALLATNDLYSQQQQAQSKYDKYDKLNGKYNPKLKKYKAYEKVKYMPYIVYYDASKQQFYYTNVPANMIINNNL